MHLSVYFCASLLKYLFSISNWDLKYHDPSVASQREYSQLEFVPTIARKELIPNIPLLTKGFASKVKGWNE